jgi:hypothetical protein
MIGSGTADHKVKRTIAERALKGTLQWFFCAVGNIVKYYALRHERSAFKISINFL